MPVKRIYIFADSVKKNERCREDKPQCCHRRLVAEYLLRHWQDVQIEHLL